MKTSKSTSFALVLLGAIWISACEQVHISHPANETQDGGQKPIPGLDFAAIQAKVFNDTAIDGRCSSCHGNWTGSYSATVSRLGEIRDRVLRSPGAPGFMPRQGNLPAEVHALLLTWIDSGAPEFVEGPPRNPPTTPEVPPPTPSLRDWDAVWANVIEPRCLGCHRTATERNDRVALSTYEEVFAQRKRVRKAVLEGEMPANGPLSDELTELLISWIDNGAPRSTPTEGDFL